MKNINVHYQDNFAYVKVSDNLDYIREKYPEAREDDYMELLLTDSTIELRDYEFVEVEHGIEETEKQQAVFHKLR